MIAHAPARPALAIGVARRVARAGTGFWGLVAADLQMGLVIWCTRWLRRLRSQSFQEAGQGSGRD